MPIETQASKEINPTIDEVRYGSGVVYLATISPMSFTDASPKETQQVETLEHIRHKMSMKKERSVGTAIITAADNDSWPISKMNSTLVVLGISPTTHERPPLPKHVQKMLTVQESSNAVVGSSIMDTSLKNILFKGNFSVDALLPVAKFVDHATVKLGKNITVSLNVPNITYPFAHMIAIRQQEQATKNPAFVKPKSGI